MKMHTVMSGLLAATAAVLGFTSGAIYRDHHPRVAVLASSCPSTVMVSGDKTSGVLTDPDTTVASCTTINPKRIR